MSVTQLRVEQGAFQRDGTANASVATLIIHIHPYSQLDCTKPLQ